MIIINVNQSNTVDLNLQSNSQLFNFSGIQPYYLFCFSSDTTHEQIKFVGQDIAPLSARPRYDSYIITETGSTYVNLSASTIDLNPGISWTYSVFEQTQQYNFDIANTVSCVDQGKVFVQGFPTTFTTTFQTGNTSFSVYNNNH